MRTQNLFLALVIAITIFFTPAILHAQAGTSSMSVGIGRSGMHQTGSRGQYVMPLPEMFRVEEFINYHRHDLPLPADGDRVRLDVQNLQLENGKTVYQFGMTTPRAMDVETMPPLNLVLVIDSSGSMDGDKICNVKKAIRSMVERFRKTDSVSIVTFSNSAKVVLDACKKTRINQINNAIDSICAGGSTNLHSGLMLGYHVAQQNFDAERTNRVIFLTDGIANVGNTDLDSIARQSKECNREGISLTTIGLGQDLNHDLLRKLADTGKGLAHFVGDDADIEKTFVNEIDSVLAPAARKVKLTVDFGETAGAVKVFGYDPACDKESPNKFKFKLDDLNHGATQVVIARVSNTENVSGKATLSYVDAITKKKVEIVKNIGKIEVRKNGRESVRRNFAIALVAKGIHTASKLSNEGECVGAEKRLKKSIAKAKEFCRGGNDPHVRRIVDIAADYQSKIKSSRNRMAVRD